MNSEVLKTECLAWLRYLRGCEMVCTEVGRYSADVWGLTDTRLIEIETKISIADLKADFRKDKHKLYEKFATEGAAKWQVPNSFYFAVPEHLLEKAQAFLATVDIPVVRKYGIITVPSEYDGCGYLGRHAKAVVKASRIHAEPPSPRARETALLRMSSELCGTRQAVALHRLRLESGLQNLTKDTVALYAREKPEAVEALEET
jgi:hypothetical protein